MDSIYQQLGTDVILTGTEVWNHGNVFPLKCTEQAKTAMQFMASVELCRYKVNKSDLPECCNGTSHQCPEDVHVQDRFSL